MYKVLYRKNLLYTVVYIIKVHVPIVILFHLNKVSVKNSELIHSFYAFFTNTMLKI